MTASSNERVVLFILGESAGSALDEKGLWNECGRKMRSNVGSRDHTAVVTSVFVIDEPDVLGRTWQS